MPPSRPPVRFQISPGVDGSEDRLAAVGGGADPLDVVEDPFQLAAGEVGGGRQSRAGADQVSGLLAQGRDDAIGACVLPDDGVVPGTSSLRVPDDGGFALVRHADGGEVGGGEAAAVEGAGD
jgi:hypothetical protein